MASGSIRDAGLLYCVLVRETWEELVPENQAHGLGQNFSQQVPSQARIGHSPNGQFAIMPD
jgi:hypothetical protein